MTSILSFSSTTPVIRSVAHVARIGYPAFIRMRSKRMLTMPAAGHHHQYFEPTFSSESHLHAKANVSSFSSPSSSGNTRPRHAGLYDILFGAGIIVPFVAVGAYLERGTHDFNEIPEHVLEFLVCP
ncbi:hypothetical protein D9758_017990 [Tetrapyrgos nigripes]|uniref:Uncharacterized protein n=1 Tax=Tetrapyrgos nigripes TaxID=182062 RepID=A0A8H5BS22_9AGAR|nr:hypothetical protein D9758_017990 [Tetrapyrgos nigripes]